MGLHGPGLEFRMELAAEEPGVILDLDDLDQSVVRGGAADHQATVTELGPEPGV